MSKQPPPAPTASAVGPYPTVVKIVGRPGTGSLPSTFAPPDHPHKKDISQNDIINFTLRPNQVLKGQGVERVHGYLVPNSCMQIVSCTCRTVAYVTIHANTKKNMASATVKHAAVEK